MTKQEFILQNRAHALSTLHSFAEYCAEHDYELTLSEFLFFFAKEWGYEEIRRISNLSFYANTRCDSCVETNRKYLLCLATIERVVDDLLPGAFRAEQFPPIGSA